MLGWSISSEGVQNYHVTLKKGDGYIKYTVNAERVMLVESDDISPRIEYITERHYLPKNVWIIIPLMFPKKKLIITKISRRNSNSIGIDIL